MADARSAQKAGRDQTRRDLRVATAESCVERRYSDAEIGDANFELEWAGLPADCPSRHLRKEDVAESRPQAHQSEWKDKHRAHQPIGHKGRGTGTSTAPDLDPCGQQGGEPGDDWDKADHLLYRGAA